MRAEGADQLLFLGELVLHGEAQQVCGPSRRGLLLPVLGGCPSVARRVQGLSQEEGQPGVPLQGRVAVWRGQSNSQQHGLSVQQQK